jgi:carbamoyltransferase
VIILGVAYLSDASACVLKDGKLLSAIGQERLNRVKLWHGVPHDAIEAALKLGGVTIDEIDVIATHGQVPAERDETPFVRKRAAIERQNLPKHIKEQQLEYLEQRRKHEARVVSERTPAYLAELKRYGKPVHAIEHHTAHAASAYYGSGWDRCYVITADGWGEDASATVWDSAGGVGKRIGLTYTFDSLGYFYGSITKALGFRPHRHEGKVLGLAAYCAAPKSYREIARMVDCLPDELRFVGCMENGLYRPHYENPRLEQYVAGFPREDVAAAVQIRLEEVVTRLVDALPGDGIKIALAGGIFANVKLNQRIAERPRVADVYVFPNMGDGGLSVGAAWDVHHRLTGTRPEPFAGALLGNELDEEEITRELQAGGLDYTKQNDIGAKAAELLAANHVVIRVAGKMEYGPRALGNRSILCHAADASINDWLNQRLQRSEFMPFAPATLAEHAEDCYLNAGKARDTARFMTVTYDCKPGMKTACPAAVHIDGTARPQIVDKTTYPGLYAILTRYHELTGTASVINTSYNMHEEPIVCSANDAIRAFKQSGLPYMALGDYLVTQ